MNPGPGTPDVLCHIPSPSPLPGHARHTRAPPATSLLWLSLGGVNKSLFCLLSALSTRGYASPLFLMGTGCDLSREEWGKDKGRTEDWGNNRGIHCYPSLTPSFSEYSQTLLGERTPLTMTDLGKLSLPRLRAVPAYKGFAAASPTRELLSSKCFLKTNRDTFVSGLNCTSLGDPPNQGRWSQHALTLSGTHIRTP